MSFLFVTIVRDGLNLTEHGQSPYCEAMVSRLVDEKAFGAMDPVVSEQGIGRMSITCDDLHVHCVERRIYEKDFMFIAVTKDVSLPKAHGMLDELSNVFVQDVVPSWTLNSTTGGLQPVLLETLSNLVTKWENHSLCDAGVDSMRDQLGAIRGVLTQSIDRLVDRGDRIELLVERSEHLNAQTTEFRQTARSLERYTWWSNARWRIGMYSAISLGLLLVLLWMYNLLRPLVSWV
ncbi:MAG: uncharacterized protein KVP18_004015 [Porospora cf. gigantea A]|uniref:uncharacterized protein n=1 Tax=Porospora cf. gigantea A TaxID=2853593 RepID=UPI00355A3450|nr:MAG: hypothetical protein KVP18_004015 [Porospora cf. gigantea A]